MTAVAAPAVLWKPHQLPHLPGGGFQMRALSCGANEALFGGAAGPGKTDVLIACDVRYSQHPSARGLFLRTEFKDLKEVMDRQQAMYPALGATWRESGKRWYWPSGAISTLGHGETLKDISGYLGQQYTHMEFDEVGLLASPTAWTMLRSRLRSTDATVPLRMRGSANPGGPGHEWLKARFVEPCGRNGERVVRDPDDPAWTIAYVPGRAADNPSLPASYWKRLAGLPPDLVAAWRDGDWDSGLGLFYPEIAGERASWFVSRDQLPRLLPDWWQYYAGYDWGFGHPATFVPMAFDGKTTYVLDCLYMHREQDHGQGAAIRGQLMTPENAFGQIPAACAARVYAGHDAFAKRQAHVAMPETVADVFNQYGVYLSRASIDREAGAKAIRRLFAAKSIKFVDTVGTRRLVAELAALVPDPKRPNVPLKRDADDAGEHGDDGADAFRYAVATYPYPANEPEAERPFNPPNLDVQDWRKLVQISDETSEREYIGGMVL